MYRSAIAGKGRPINTTTVLGKVIERRNLRVYEVAARAGLNPKTLSSILNGKVAMNAEHRARLAQALDVPAHVL